MSYEHKIYIVVHVKYFMQFVIFDLKSVKQSMYYNLNNLFR